jgi:hypothetical protein
MACFKLRVMSLIFLMLLFLMPVHAARAAESYDNCTGFIDVIPAVISTSGTWCLRSDLASGITSGSAITVATNNVTIDCNDFKLGGLAAGAGTLTRGISAANRFNTTVRNCSIRGFFYGIEFWGGDHTIEDNRFDGNTYSAINVYGDGSVIRRNRVVDTGGSTQTNAATAIFAADSADVIDNIVSGVSAVAGTNGFAIGINTQDNPDGRIVGNGVRGIVSSGSGFGGATLGIYNNTPGRITLRANDVVGDGSAGSQGLTCNNTQARAKDNVVSGFASGNLGCSDDGGNVIVP